MTHITSKRFSANIENKGQKYNQIPVIAPVFIVLIQIQHP